MANYIITGVAGFVGSAVARALLAEGHTIVGVDNLSSGRTETIPQGIEFIRAACHEPDLYTTKIPKKPYDAILHIAGQNSGELSFADPVYDLQANTESTLHLLRFAREVGCKRFVYASSKAVYGDQPDEPVQEEAKLQPRSCYGVAKMTSEHYLRLFEQFGISSTALRLFSVYGPGQDMVIRQGMVSTFMTMVVQAGHIHIKGSPNRFRDFVYIDDVVEAFIQSLKRPQSGGMAINVAGSSRVYVGDLIEKLCTLSKEPVTIEYSGHTAGDVYGIHADIARAAKYLGYDPAVTFDDGLKRMYDWYNRELRDNHAAAR